MSSSAAHKIAERAVATSVAVGDDLLRISLADGRELAVPLAWFPKLIEATTDQLENWRLIGGGTGIHWEELDEDLSVAGLLRGERPKHH